MSLGKSLYNIDIKYQGEEVDFDMENFNFLIHDSIHETYPKMKLGIQDASSFLQEYLFGVEGTELEIEMKIGDNGEHLTNKFTFADNSMPNSSSGHNLGGEVVYNLIHNSAFKQSKLSEGFNSRISDIVRDKLDNYEFNDIIINDTGNNDLWYQPFMKDFEFIRKFLLPYAYSQNSNNSPFYFFINANNEANFVNYKGIKDNKLDYKLSYGLSESGQGGMSQVLNLKRMTLGASLIHDLKNIKRYGLSLDGSLREYSGQTISDVYTTSNNGKEPLVHDSSLITKILEKDEESVNGKIENNNGYMINLMSKFMGLEKLIMITPFNPFLRAGYSFDFSTYSFDFENTPSINYTDNYIIEESNHVWSGQAYTQIIASRKTVSPDSNEVKIYSDLGV